MNDTELFEKIRAEIKAKMLEEDDELAFYAQTSESDERGWMEIICPFCNHIEKIDHEDIIAGFYCTECKNTSQHPIEIEMRLDVVLQSFMFGCMKHEEFARYFVELGCGYNGKNKVSFQEFIAMSQAERCDLGLKVNWINTYIGYKNMVKILHDKGFDISKIDYSSSGWV